MRDLDRILDANANRAAEGLRVMEDAARFLLDDGVSSAALKNLRHELRALLSAFGAVTDARATDADVGRAISTPGETVRASVVDVVRAAAGRATEALRAIEEYGKLIDAAAAAGFEALRYRVYEEAARLESRLARPSASWRVCVLLTEAQCRRPWEKVAEAAIDGGAGCLQLREPELDDRELLARTARLVGLAADRAAVIVNDRADVARLAGATGVHLGQSDVPVEAARSLLGDRAVIGVSTSSLDQAVAARAAGADYCGVGPMFPTGTKAKDVIVGPDYLRAYTAWGGLPHLAIGGIDASRLPALVEAGATGVAVCASVCGADDPRRVVAGLNEALAARAAVRG